MTETLEEAQARADACQREAEGWKMEAMAHKSSLHQVYQLLTDAKGEPANWNGARPVRQFLEADRETFAEWLRAWVHRRYGKWITHSTARDAFFAFDLNRRDRTRKMLADTSIIPRAISTEDNKPEDPTDA